MRLIRRVRRIAPSPSAAIAVVALVLAMGGLSIAAPPEDKKSDEVVLTTATGGPVNSTDPGERVPIPLSNATFTQRAGEAVLIAATATLVPDANTSFCGAEVNVSVAPTSGSDPGTSEVGLFMEEHTNKGDFGLRSDSEALPAPATDVTRTLVAYVVESSEPQGEPECDNPDPEGELGPEDTWGGSVRITVVRMR
jgi:hypothetical protein